MLSERRSRVCVDPVSAHAMEEAVKEALSRCAIVLVTLQQPITFCADFTAGTYDRVRLVLRYSPGVAVDPLATIDGEVAFKCASV